MKTKFLIAITMIFIFSSVSFCAVSEDQEIYLRRDVFEAKMDALIAEIRLGHEQIRREMHEEIQQVQIKLHEEIQQVQAKLHAEIQQVQAKLHEEIQQVQATLHGEIQTVEKNLTKEIHGLNTKIEVLSERVNGVEKRMSSWETHLGWVFALLTIIVAVVALLPVFGEPLLKKFKSFFKPKITIEDIQKLITESIEKNNTQLLQKLNLR